MAEEEISTPKSKHHNLGDTLGFIGLAVGMMLYAFSPSVYTRGGVLLAGVAICIYLAFRSHFVRTFELATKRIIALVVSVLLLTLGSIQLFNSGWLNGRRSLQILCHSLQPRHLRLLSLSLLLPLVRRINLGLPKHTHIIVGLPVRTTRK